MENIMDLMIHILSPIINSEEFDLLFGLCLNKGFEIFEVLKDLIFFPEKVDPCKGGIVSLPVFRFSSLLALASVRRAMSQESRKFLWKGGGGMK
jgi:hypothetical protein